MRPNGRLLLIPNVLFPSATFTFFYFLDTRIFARSPYPILYNIYLSFLPYVVCVVPPVLNLRCLFVLLFPDFPNLSSLRQFYVSRGPGFSLNFLAYFSFDVFPPLRLLQIPEFPACWPLQNRLILTRRKDSTRQNRVKNLDSPKLRCNLGQGNSLCRDRAYRLD